MVQSTQDADQGLPEGADEGYTDRCCGGGIGYGATGYARDA